jgi:hypothetical protein
MHTMARGRLVLVQILAGRLAAAGFTQVAVSVEEWIVG